MSADRAAVEEALQELKRQVRRRRARLTAGLGPGGDRGSDLNLVELQNALREMNQTWFISAHLPIAGEGGLVGRATSFAKKVTRYLLRWYINPTVDQQNAFNAAASRALLQMAAYQDRLAREWQFLDQRLDVLEQRLRAEARGEAPAAAGPERGGT